MRIDFDPAKDKLNLASHGLSLAFAAELAWDEALVWVDDRFEYDELRMVGLVPQGNRLYYVAFVDRAGTRRVISLRLAERREVKHYVENCPPA
ncbi:MAG: BrnT family toxin [Leptothrix sp. (in: Bacteria)]|nr:BrnT family toxin [Leptothrix sp. (in: b-proteobacteria)]